MIIQKIVTKIVLIGIVTSSLFFFVACDSDDEGVELPNQEEIITTLRYELTPSGGGAMKTFVFQVLDGDGGDAPVISVENLQANTSYSGRLILLNEAANPVESISEEVEDEEEEHQFFFSVSPDILTISYIDQDSNGFPVGLQTTLTTAQAGSAAFTVILRHEPEKGASGVSDGLIANAGGETDIEVTFQIQIEP